MEPKLRQEDSHMFPILGTVENYRGVLSGDNIPGYRQPLRLYDIVLLRLEEEVLFGVIIQDPSMESPFIVCSPSIAEKGLGWNISPHSNLYSAVSSKMRDMKSCLYVGSDSILGISRISEFRKDPRTPYWHSDNIPQVSTMSAANVISLEHWLENVMSAEVVPGFVQDPVWFGGQACALCKRCRTVAYASNRQVHDIDECPLLVSGTDNCLGGAWEKVRSNNSLEHKLMMINAMLQAMMPVKAGDAVVIEVQKQHLSCPPETPQYVRGLLVQGGNMLLFRKNADIPPLFIGGATERLLDSWSINAHKGNIDGIVPGRLTACASQESSVLRVPHSKQHMINRLHHALAPEEDGVLLDERSRPVLGVANNADGVPGVIVGSFVEKELEEFTTPDGKVLGIWVAFGDGVLDGMYDRGIPEGDEVQIDADEVEDIPGTCIESMILLYFDYDENGDDYAYFMGCDGKGHKSPLTREYDVYFNVMYSGPSVSVLVRAHNEDDSSYVDFDSVEAELGEIIEVDEA
jgi:hypothetical protein